MKYIRTDGIHDPSVNLAIEEYALMHLPMDEPYLLFYINEPSIIIGRNQNTIEEINTDYVEENHIHVVRRLSGGGAVYHDLGNLNYSFIVKDDGKSFHNYKKFTEPVIKALRELGVEAELTGRNDIQVGSSKISGNAQFAVNGRMFNHGTLLFNTNLDDVSKALKVKQAKIESKGVKSVRSRVANISEFLKEPMTIEQFRTHLLHSIFEGQPIREYELTDQDWEKISEISETRYRNWDWNYGHSPRSNIIRNHRLEGIGTIELHMQIDRGAIQALRIFGDYFGTDDVSELEKQLIGVPYRKEDLAKALQSTDVGRYIGKLDRDTFISLFF